MLRVNLSLYQVYETKTPCSLPLFFLPMAVAVVFSCYSLCKLFQFVIPKVEHLIEDVVTGIAAIDAVVTVGVVEHVELLVGLYKSFCILHAVAYMDVVVGHTVH